MQPLHSTQIYKGALVLKSPLESGPIFPPKALPLSQGEGCCKLDAEIARISCGKKFVLPRHLREIESSSLQLGSDLLTQDFVRQVPQKDGI